MEEKELLLIDESFAPTLTIEECEKMKPIIKDFIECYAANKDLLAEQWMGEKMQEYLPEKSPEEIQEIVKEITESIKITESKKDSLTDAVESGRSKESWFASEVQKATSAMSMEGTKQYLTGLDTAVKEANAILYEKTLLTKSGTINQSKNLGGFIAEQYHVQTFNMNAEAAGSRYRARVKEPQGGYTKNGVDTEIFDTVTGKVVKKYQSKYYKDATETLKAFGNKYRGQQKLVPSDQKSDILAKVTDVMEAPDGTKSNSLSKARAEQMREEAQSGNWQDLNWNEYSTKDLARGIGKQAGYAALQGAAIGVGFDLAKKVWDGEEIKGEEVVETALKSGADAGVKAATAGAIKVGAEKGIISVIKKGTSSSVISNIAFVAVENVKIMGKVATGELTVSEGMEKMGQTTVAATAGLAAMGKGAAIGTAVGALLGPVGAAVGGFIGGAVGYAAGSKVGEAVFNGAKKIAKRGREIVGRAVEGIKNVGSSIMSGLRSFLPW